MACPRTLAREKASIDFSPRGEVNDNDGDDDAAAAPARLHYRHPCNDCESLCSPCCSPGAVSYGSF